MPRYEYSIENGDDPDVVACERLGEIAFQLERIADPLAGEDAEFIEDGGQVRSEWILICLRDNCDFADRMIGDCHPRDGPPEHVEEAVREHKQNADGDHMVRVEGRIEDDDGGIDPHLVTDGGQDTSEFWHTERLERNLEVHTCPDCDYTATAEQVREVGGCILENCDYEVEESK